MFRHNLVTRYLRWLILTTQTNNCLVVTWLRQKLSGGSFSRWIKWCLYVLARHWYNTFEALDDYISTHLAHTSAKLSSICCQVTLLHGQFKYLTWSRRVTVLYFYCNMHDESKIYHSNVSHFIYSTTDMYFRSFYEFLYCYILILVPRQLTLAIRQSVWSAIILYQGHPEVDYQVIRQFQAGIAYDIFPGRFIPDYVDNIVFYGTYYLRSGNRYCVTQITSQCWILLQRHSKHAYVVNW